ncbi:spore-associated protein A [Micromonospora deserti]|uniref:spore-associated protein A n=1 Tax=Micromonospora deserti TaxID=2070366 RepID=UPI00131410FC|nr:spore-associated protein A [Micromonospora deserti]
MNIPRTLASVGTVAALAAGTVAVAAAPAQAAAYNGACGSGYRVIDKMNINMDRATVYLTYNSGWNCVVTITNTPGKREYMSAQIERSNGGDWIEDEGYYTQYAGPVYVYAPNECIDWGGSIAYTDVTWIQWDDHCG